MWKSGGADPRSVSAEPQRPRSRLRGITQLVLTLAVASALVVFGFPLISALRIDVPTDIRFGSASSMTFRITNPNLTPLTDVEYSCEVSQLTLANGSAINDAKVLNRGSIRKLTGRHAVAGHCQAGYLITTPLKAAEYQLRVTYRSYPWPQQRTNVYRISAQFNTKSEVTGWKLY
jgi:hypothetical protein